MYGLKQASHAWNKQADKSLKSLGFKRCLSDSGIYVRNVETSITICVIYVDDILFMGSHEQTIHHIKQKFMKMWECRDLGKIKEYLGMNIVHNKNLRELVVDQAAYEIGRAHV